MKAANTLAENGWQVEVLGAWSDANQKERDRKLMAAARFRFTPVIDLTSNKTAKLRARVRNKCGRLAHRYAGLQNRWQLGYIYPELRKAAFQRRADLYIAHSEQAMAVAVDLLRAGRLAGVDMEDWFSEDLPAEARRHRPVALLRALERELLERGAYASCTSQSMSGALAEAYGCDRPAVLYNAFPWAERQALDGLTKDRRDRGRRSIHWYSQAIGPGRGLEDLFAALPLLRHDVEVHLRGSPVAGSVNWLNGLVPEAWRGRIILHDIVTNAELLSRIAEHDIGFAGEMKYCKNKELTISNKILQYLLAGNAVVASDTTGQREVADQATGAVSLYSSGDSVALAASLNALLGSSIALQEAKASALRAAERTFCWERQEATLLSAVEQAVRR